MPAIDPYESPARAINRQNRQDRLVAKQMIARNNPGYGYPAPGNTTGPNTTGDNWEKFFRNTRRNTPMPPATPREQQGFAAAAQQRAIMARRTPPKQRIQPFAPAPLPKPMQVEGTSMTQQTPYGSVDVSYVPRGTTMPSKRIADETGDRTKEFAENARPRINPLATSPRRLNTR